MILFILMIGLDEDHSCPKVIFLNRIIRWGLQCRNILENRMIGCPPCPLPIAPGFQPGDRKSSQISHQKAFKGLLYKNLGMLPETPGWKPGAIGRGRGGYRVISFCVYIGLLHIMLQGAFMRPYHQIGKAL